MFKVFLVLTSGDSSVLCLLWFPLDSRKYGICEVSDSKTSVLAVGYLIESSSRSSQEVTQSGDGRRKV